MISVENLKVEFGTRPLFHDVSFVINDRDRVALVGKNGAGKSTMLKILCGLQKPTSGTVSVPNGSSVGYLPQVMKLQDDTTVREETRKAFAGHIHIKEQLDKMQQEMAERTDYESEDYMALVDKFTQTHERYMMMGGENYEAEMERTLTGLGFERSDFDRPTREFSGGWRMRIELAKILLQHPDVLLLDEPTNHLDIESIQWLEQFLAQSSSAVVLVSHDRAFINNVTNRTLEITCGHVEDYKVKYDQYVVLRKERREQQLRAYENQQKEIADTKAFIERFRYQATKAVQVQQRIRQLEKIVPIEVDDVDNKVMHLKFPPCLRSGDYPVICDDVRKDYGTHTIFSHVNMTIKRGEKVAFVGKNGEGKSTLVKCIMGQIPFTGTLKIAHNVQIGYFAQNQAQLLDESLTIYDTIDRVATGEMRLKINDLLGAFMFGGEISEKKVGVLSGGERSCRRRMCSRRPSKLSTVRPSSSATTVTSSTDSCPRSMSLGADRSRSISVVSMTICGLTMPRPSTRLSTARLPLRKRQPQPPLQFLPRRRFSLPQRVGLRSRVRLSLPPRNRGRSTRRSRRSCARPSVPWKSLRQRSPRWRPASKSLMRCSWIPRMRPTCSSSTNTPQPRRRSTRKTTVGWNSPRKWKSWANSLYGLYSLYSLYSLYRLYKFLTLK